MIGIYAAVELVYYGIKVRWIPTPWNASYGHQVLDPTFFKQNFLQAFLYLHIQPPLYNLQYAIFDVIGFKGLSTFLMGTTNLVVGLAVCVGTYLLALELHLHRWWSVALASLAVISPSFIIFLWFPYFTIDTQALVVWLLVCVARYVRTSNRRYAAGACWCAAGLVLLNPTYQILFLAGVLALLWYARRRDWLVLVKSAAVPVGLVLAWYIKTAVVFGLFATSSWYGMNLAHVTTADEPKSTIQSLVDHHVLTPLALLPPFQAASTYEPEFVSAPHTGVPVLDANSATFSGPNFNNRALISIDSQYLGNDLSFILNNPGDYLGNVAQSMSVWFVPGDRYYWAKVRPQINSYANAFDHLVSLEVSPWQLSRRTVPHAATLTTLSWALVLVYLVVLFGLPIAYFRYRRRLQLPFAVLGVAWFMIVYTFVVTTFLDFGANNENRLDLASTPLLCAIALAVAVWRASADRPTPAVDVPTGEAVPARQRRRERRSGLEAPPW